MGQLAVGQGEMDDRGWEYGADAAAKASFGFPGNVYQPAGLFSEL